MVCAGWTDDELRLSEEVADLFARVGIYLRERGQYSEAEALQLRVLSFNEQHFGIAHTNTAYTQNNLALTYITQSKHEQAESLLESALPIMEKQLGVEHPETVMIQGNLAALYIRQGKHEQAEPLLIRALSILERQLDAEHPDIAKAQSSLAHVYVQQHKYDLAEPLLQQAIAIQEKHFGTLLPQLASNLYDLSLVLYCQGKQAQAEAAQQRFFSIQEQQSAAKDTRIELTGRKHTDFLHSLELAAQELAEAEAKAREVNEELRTRVLQILGMTESSKDKQEAVLSHIESTARKRMALGIPELLTDEQVEYIDKMDSNGASEVEIKQYIESLLPATFDELLEATILDVAEQLVGLQ
jgi:tetratricopeptide (TPR) repeat protein